MQNVNRLQTTGFLTRKQAATARDIFQGKLRVDLPAPMMEILQALVCNDRPLQEFEQDLGWASRSAKVVLAVILDACASAPNVSRLRLVDCADIEVKRYIDDQIGAELAKICEVYRVSLLQAKLLAMLNRRAGRAVTYDALIRAAWADGNEPQDASNTLRVHIRKVRQRLKGRGVEIMTIWGAGYKLMGPLALATEGKAAMGVQLCR